MKLLRCVVTAAQINDVKNGLAHVGVLGMTVSEAGGRRRIARTIAYANQARPDDVPMSLLHIVLDDELVEEAIRVVMDTTSPA